MPVFSINKTLAAIQLLAQSGTQENAERVAGLIGVKLMPKNTIVEYTTKKGKVIRGVVRTDLSYAEAKAIDEYTFKKDGGWFIREKHLGVDIQAIDNQTTSTPQSEPETVLQSDTLVNDEDNNIKGLERKFKPAAKKYKNPEINLEPKESAKLLKKTLTKLFPDTKFSVSMSRGTAYGSVSVSWVDGASYDLVNVIAQHFRGKGFDGSTDSTHYLNAINEDGKIVSYGLGYVSISRTYSREFLEKLKLLLPDHFQKQMTTEGVTIKGSGDSAYFDAKENWTRDGIRNAQISHSTSKYNFGVVPQAENDESEDFTLSGQSEAERLAKENEIKLIEQQKRQADEKAHLKAQADKELNDFRLSGSSLPSDVAASYGQGDMFVTTRKQKQIGENNVSSSSNPLESDSNTGSRPDTQSSVENGNDDESAELGRMARPPVNGLDARGGSERDSSTSLSENDGIGIGARGDTVVSDGAGQRGAGERDNASDGGGSDSVNEPRSPVVAKRDAAVVRVTVRDTSTNDLKLKAQLEAEGVATNWGDTDSINKALPYLLPEQRDDVVKAEKRLIDDNKNGMLFTNGTGTGKTFTGLGAVKRFANAGKKNILIVSMNDKIIRDFVKSALSLNLDIHQLDGVTDNGKDKIVATTYANLAQNLMLGKRDWDLIVVDEAHNLMQGEKGENTNALAKLRALSGHHSGFGEWVKMRHAEKDPKPIGENPETGNPIYDQDEVSAWEQFKKPLREQWKKTWAEQPKGRTKVIFLTATPFSYVKTLDWAEGYLFDFVPPAKKFSNDTEAMGAAYNSGSEYERFYMDNFGYKMRTNRLTRPDSRVDVGILERKFSEKLKTEGAMSGRDLSVPFDYDRKFVLIDSKIGEKIDEGFKFLWDTKDKDGKSKYSELLRVLNKRFDYLARLQLLEAIKAQEAIEQIKKHIALGRKVIVFHDYNEGGGSNPFVYVGGATQDEVGAVESQYEDFKRARPDLIALDLDLDAPITTIKKAFPDALLYNGRVAKGQRSKNADLFNTDSNGHNVLIAQSDAAATGISFHDTTGKHQRVIINIGMPSKPAKLRQTEGRIYRVGQASNAIQRYLTTGTNWERSTFSQKIAERAETVDNLAQGESAVVSIKDALVQAYEEAEYFEPSENDGIGGKAYDEENARINKLTPFERAKSDYWVKQKVTAKRQDREGKEWYATPEPVGLFMVNLSGAHSGDDILEPSAGDGAIGRYMPSDASVTFIEPSESLASRARMNNTNANVIVDSFESHGSNNKYDAIVMNPPFGQGGSIAIKHLVKAFEHLRIGGRVVALLPSGNMDNLIVDYSNKGYFAGIYQVAKFALPSSTFKNAGTAVNTKIYVFEKHENKSDVTTGFVSKDLSHYDDIEDLFDAIENINIKPRKPRIDEALAEYGLEIYPDRSKYIITGEGLKRKDITSRLFGSYIEKNKDGDVVEKYNRSIAYLKWLKDSQIPNMAQFNNGLSFNNLPIKYQGQVDKYDTWDGVGDMPVWLSVAMRVSDVELENFAVEKPQYDSLNGNTSLMETLALITSLSKKKDDAVAQQLADAIGVRIKKPISPIEFLKGDAVASIKSGQIKRGEDGKVILQAKEWMRDGSPSTVKSVETIKKQFISPLSAPVAPVITQSTDETSETLGEQADENIAQVQNTASDDELLIAKLEKEIIFWDKVSFNAKSYNKINEAIEKIKLIRFLIRFIKNDFYLDRADYATSVLGRGEVNIITPKERNKFKDAKTIRESNANYEYVVKKLYSYYKRELKKLKLKDEFNSETSNTSLMDPLALKPSPPDFTLSTYTESDLRAQEAVLNAAESKRQADEKAAKDKAIADKQVGDFRLSGSSMPSDVAASYGQNDMFVQTRGQTKTITVKVPLSANTLNGYAPNAWGDLSKLPEDVFLKTWQYVNAANYMLRNSIEVSDAKNGNRHVLGQSGKPEMVKLVNDEFTKRGLDQKYSLFVERKAKPQYDDLGGFTFTPVIALDQTLDAIAALASNNSQANAERLAQLLGVKLAPKQELDMFGEPIQHQELDMFGDPIQTESPIQELPRLAIEELPLGNITLSDDVPQFKSGADDDTGVVEPLGGKFDRTGVAPIQVWRRLDGRLEVISGRHRLDLATRSGEKTIPAQVHNEADGFDAKKAGMLDAELNIRDGQGKVRDYVDYFTHSGVTKEQADERGLLARSIGQRAFAIASQGSDELLSLHRNEMISDQASADIATLAPSNSAMQAVGLRVLQESKPLNNALNTMRAVMALTREKGQEPDTFDLFGFDDSALKEAEAMARIASRKQRQIAEQLNAIKGAVKNPKLAAKHGVFVENQADALEKVKTMTALKSRWDNWSSHADLLAEVRQEIAEKGGYDSILDDECFDEYDSLAMPSMTDYDVVDVDTVEIKLNPTAYQWRNNVTGDGTEKGRVIAGTFNYDDQPPLILHRRLSGRVYLADGHHRYKMAKASHAPIVKAIVLDEHDGYTVPAMRVLCGFLNLRKEALVKDRVNLPMVNMAKTADLVRKAVENEMGW